MTDNGPDPVDALAQAWGALDPLQRYVDAAPDGPMPVDELVREYLDSHDPYPAGTRVSTRGLGAAAEWEPATILDRPGSDEWTVEFDDGATAWRDHTEIRPNPAPGT
ncbi:tudor domain-containing protein [Luteimicrobium sp. DT211]|uniref:tudor domain-containing protein n=1 Tax=Luteimicrobium sp. DT211 TaxID=3393412 RepID=UPI003CF79355